MKRALITSITGHGPYLEGLLLSKGYQVHGVIRLDSPLEWTGEGEREQGIDRRTGEAVIAIDPHYFRPAEVDLLLGDATKDREKMGWEPRTGFEKLVGQMVEANLRLAAQEKLLRC